MAEQRDRELLNQFLARQDAASLECLIRRHADLVFAVCTRVLRNRHDAEDAFQATFLIMVSRPPRLRRNSSLSGWLFRVANRTAMRVARERRRLVQLDDPMLPAPEPFEDVYRQEAVLALDEEMSTLPERYRAPLVLCSLMGMSRREAAAQLGRSEASVKASLTRGKHLLRTRLLRRGILLSVAAAAGNQLSASTAGASEQIVQMTSQLCGGTVPIAGGSPPSPSPEIQSLANAGVREMTSALTSKLTASAVAATVIASGVLVANIDTPSPAAAVPPLGTTVLEEEGDSDLVAFQSESAPTPLVEGTGFNSMYASRQPQPASGPMAEPVAQFANAFPSRRAMYDRAVEYERTRDETLIDIEYHKSMADVMEMKAEAKQIEAQAMGAGAEERDAILSRSREIFAIAESREYAAEAARLSATAELLDRRLTALGAPFQSEDGTIQAGDMLTIRLNPDPEGIWGTRRLTVSADGSVTLPYVGDVQATGMTIRQFGDRLVAYYKAGNVFENPVFEISHTRAARSQQLMPAVNNTTNPQPLNQPGAAPAYGGGDIVPRNNPSVSPGATQPAGPSNSTRNDPLAEPQSPTPATPETIPEPDPSAAPTPDDAPLPGF